MNTVLSGLDIDRVIEMAWEDRTPFEAIEKQFGLREPAVTEIMRKYMVESSFRLWRKRMKGRKAKHFKKRPEKMNVFHCDRQRSISHNKISKRY